MTMKAELLGVIFLFSIVVSAELPQQYWPRWRGPSNAGNSSTAKVPVKWNHTENVKWKVKLPGIGCSTPVVWGDNILITSPIDGQDTVLNYDWSGKLKWQTKVGQERRGKHRNGSGSNPSVETDGKSAFAYFKSGNLGGLDMSGKLLWKTNLQEKFGKDTLYWDLGNSPVLTANYVIVAVMHNDSSFIAAFKKADGEMVWKQKRVYKTPAECDHSYTTPIVIGEPGKEHIITWGAEHLTAHSAVDGKQLWECAGFNPKKQRNWVQVSSHVIAGDIAVIPYGRGSRLAGIRLGGEGDVTATNRIWTREDTGSFVPTPAADEGKVYLLRDQGEVECIDPESGKSFWKGSLPKHRSKYYSSPVVADGKLIAAREDGVIFVARLAEDFEVLSENVMGERVIASPVPIGNQLLIRGEQHLYCIGK
jgi:outer membrane protein assembly factor BamB